jgi:predicted DNA-binding protein (UPF0251 family)
MLITVPRPLVPRRIGCRFSGRGFRPIGRPACELPTVALGLDELEAIRLVDRELLYQDAAAERMGISRQTFARILDRARRAVAECLVDGKVLVVQPAATIEGPPEYAGCPIHDETRRRGRGCRCRARAGGRGGARMSDTQ